MLLRRIPRKPDFRVPDVITGRLVVTRAALRLDPDGMSTQMNALLHLTPRNRANVYDWSRHNGIEFPVGSARQTGQAGVLATPNPEDAELGACHASVRVRPDSEDVKADWDDVRAAIAEVATLMPEDPHPPEPLVAESP